MKIRLRGPNVYFMRFVAQAKIILDTWAKLVGVTVFVAVLIGVFVPLAVAAFIFTIFLPIILLVLWGRALEAELGWTDPDRWRR